VPRRNLPLFLGLCLASPAARGTDFSPLLHDMVPVPEGADLRPGGRPMRHPGAGRLVFLNGGGGVYTSGWPNDSVTNRSSVIAGDSATLPVWSYDEASWETVLSCVQDLFADFDVHVTDEDPGDVPHVECAVGGSPRDIGWPDTVGGVAPAGCGIIEEAIVFVFSNVYSGNLDSICWTAGQEIGHAYGLDHENYCDDVMSYDHTCPDKGFTDRDANCGEFASRPCRCGGETQNSYQILLDRLGPHPPNAAPFVSIVTPGDGSVVEAGFQIDVEASDDLGVDFVRLRLAGEFVENDGLEPWHFVAPDDLPAGALLVEVEAMDYDGASATDSVTVTVITTDDCGGDPLCADAAPEADAGPPLRRKTYGCGCRTGGAGGSGAMLAALAFLYRRRK